MIYMVFMGQGRIRGNFVVCFFVGARLCWFFGGSNGLDVG